MHQVELNTKSSGNSSKEKHSMYTDIIFCIRLFDVDKHDHRFYVQTCEKFTLMHIVIIS